MHTITFHCDACGQKIEGASTRCRVKDPVVVQHWWSILGRWVEMDICPDCFKGLKAIAESLALVKQARKL
jgi:ribosomal protein L31